MVTLRALKQRLDKRSKSNGDNHSSLLWSSVNGASTLSIITFSIMIKYDTHRNDTRHNCTEHCYAESFMLSVIYKKVSKALNVGDTKWFLKKRQGTLCEGEGSVQLTSFYQLV